MFSKTKIAAAALTAAVLAGALLASPGTAEAHWFHHGWGWHGYGNSYGCHWSPRFNVYGDYIGSVRYCRW